MSAIAVERMAAAYDGAPVLTGVSFEVPPGPAIALLGGIGFALAAVVRR